MGTQLPHQGDSLGFAVMEQAGLLPRARLEGWAGATRTASPSSRNHPVSASRDSSSATFSGKSTFMDFRVIPSSKTERWRAFRGRRAGQRLSCHSPCPIVCQRAATFHLFSRCPTLTPAFVSARSSRFLSAPQCRTPNPQPPPSYMRSICARCRAEAIANRAGEGWRAQKAADRAYKTGARHACSVLDA